MLKLTAAGACAALALGYSGAVALDGIGMTAAQDGSSAVLARTVHQESPSNRFESGSVEQTVAEQQATEMPPPTERQAAAASPELDEAQASPMSTGSLGDAPARQSATPSGDKLNLAPPSEALREDRAADDESIPLGIGLAKMGPFEMPPAPAVEPRPEPRALRNVELMERPPPPPKLELPQERVIQIGPKAPTDAADKAAKPAQKARKSAKRKPKNNDFLSYFGL